MNLLSEEHLAQAISEEVRSVGTDGLTRGDTSALNTSCPLQRSAATLLSRPTGTGHVLHTTHLQGWVELPGLASTSACRRHGDRLRHPFPGPRVRFPSSPTYQLGGGAESAPPEPSLHRQSTHSSPLLLLSQFIICAHIPQKTTLEITLKPTSET